MGRSWGVREEIVVGEKILTVPRTVPSKSTVSCFSGSFDWPPIALMYSLDASSNLPEVEWEFLEVELSNPGGGFEIGGWRR